MSATHIQSFTANVTWTVHGDLRTPAWWYLQGKPFERCDLKGYELEKLRRALYREFDLS